MKVIVEFESWVELEEFRTSGKKTRGAGKTKDDEPAQEEAVAQAINQAQPVQQVFAPPPPPSQTSFPSGGNGGSQPVHPLVTAILARIDGAVATGQSNDDVVRWFRQQIGPEAATATLDQIKQVFIPRMSEQQLKNLAPLLGLQ